MRDNPSCMGQVGLPRGKASSQPTGFVLLCLAWQPAKHWYCSPRKPIPQLAYGTRHSKVQTNSRPCNSSTLLLSSPLSHGIHMAGPRVRQHCPSLESPVQSCPCSHQRSARWQSCPQKTTPCFHNHKYLHPGPLLQSQSTITRIIAEETSQRQHYWVHLKHELTPHSSTTPVSINRTQLLPMCVCLGA